MRPVSLTIDAVRAALQLASEGPRSDFDLDPEMRARHLGITERKPAAVLCALRPGALGLQVILTQRAAHLKHHAAQVAFPGGKVDRTDADATAAALREADEEIGLPTGHVDVLGTLDPYLTSTGYWVTPVVGFVEPAWQPMPNPGEVDEVFEPPLDFLMDPANRKRHTRVFRGVERAFYAIPWQGYYIWGATAGMLKGLSDRLDIVAGRGA